METVVVRIAAKEGMEDKVEQFYLSQQAEYEAAEGFIDRTILRARTGAMIKTILSRLTPEQIAKRVDVCRQTVYRRLASIMKRIRVYLRAASGDV